MMTKHTPGPWEFCGNDSLPILHVYAPDHRNIFHGERPLEEQDANARLIAAAPDLLDALDETLKTLLAWVGHYSDREPKDLPAVVKAVAAIAKAIGEQS